MSVHDRWHTAKPTLYLIVTREPQRCEFALDVQQGTRWFEARVCAVPNQEQVVWVSWDISERRAAENDQGGEGDNAADPKPAEPAAIDPAKYQNLASAHDRLKKDAAASLKNATPEDLIAIGMKDAPRHPVFLGFRQGD